MSRYGLDDLGLALGDFLDDLRYFAGEVLGAMVIFTLLTIVNLIAVGIIMALAWYFL